MPSSPSHTFDPSILRAYDIRGIVDETLTEQDARALGRVFGATIKANGGSHVCVGYDGRLSSPPMEAALVQGLAEVGVNVSRVGLGPTPLLYFATKHTKADAGIMVTGSHNPPTHNGFKIMLATGPFYGDAIQKLGVQAAAGSWQPARQPSAVRALDIEADYLDKLVSDFTGDPSWGAEDLTVVWDPGNGAAGEVMQKLATRLPGKHVVINGTIDGTFPSHHPDPTVAKNLVQLQEAVAKEKAHLGIAFDGDGDRIGAVTSTGEIIWGDQLLSLYAREVLTDQPGATIITDVKASQVLFDEVARLGGTPLMWRTGHSPIKEKMMETGSPLSGEMSGHVFFADRYYGFDDALYAGVRLLNACAPGVGVDPLMAAMPKFVNTSEIRVDVPEDRKFQMVADIAAAVRAQKEVTIVDLDGIRVITPLGWWLVRASNTQAALTIRFESPTEKDLSHLVTEVRSLLASFDVQVPTEL